MSTKTTFKRVALVAVASLGFGVLTSVAPASAAAAVATDVTIAAPGTGRVNSIFTSTIAIDTAAIGDDVSPLQLRARFDAKPAGSTSTVGFSSAGQTMVDTTTGNATALTPSILAANAAGNELLPAGLKLTPAASEGIPSITPGTRDIAGSVGFIPDVVGTYTVTVWDDGVNGDGLIGSAEEYSTVDFVVGNAPSSVKVTSLSGTGIVGQDALVKLELLDAAGAAAGLAANESITLTSGSTDTDITFINGAGAGGASTQTLTASSFVKGVSYIGLNDDLAAGQTVTITIAGVGGSVTSLSGTFTQKFVPSQTPTAGATVMTTGATTAATYGVASNNAVTGTIDATKIPVGSKTLTYLTTITAGITTLTTDTYVGVAITDVSGYTTGAAVQGITTDIVFTKAITLTESTTTAGTFAGAFTVTTAAPTAASQFSATVNDDDGAGTPATDDTAIAVASEDNALASGSTTVSPSTAISAKIGGSVSYVVTVKDKFGRAFANANVTMSISGRNANQTVVVKSSVSDSTGKATFTYTDAPLAGTTLLADTITFSAIGNAGGAQAASAVTVNWSATGPVVGATGVTVTTGTEDDTASSITYRDISASATGAQAGAATITATVKDASGNLLAGVPVTFSTASAGAAVLSTSVTKYTGADGTTTASVYGWTAGAKTFTATAGGVSGSGTVNYKQTTATDVRTIAAKVEGSIVTVTATDRFGNTVEGVKIYGTKTGTGYFGNGSSTSSATTDKNGAAEFVVQGTGSFKFAAGDATAADLEYGDTDAVADKVGTTAVTATTVGTATTAETGVGASFAAAGVNSVTLDISVANASEAAADAAAEATDAANAATDAANAAAEAADAATAAAQDAADAVAALSTSVTAMVADLRKQITALTNLVIKIQKKVKA
jgi:trimeric autotransporter adhesin